MIIFLLSLNLLSCGFDGLSPIANETEMKAQLSEYQIFQSNPADLIPNGDFHLFELSTELFTDYAHKQRLIRIPNGTKISVNGDGLPDYPDGTILVKTFYYLLDERDSLKGKKIIETRLEIKSNSHWSVGTYLWNDDQTEATRLKPGLTRTVNWIDKNGKGQVIAYHIPSTRECTTCHSTNGAISPIGPKLRNLNCNVIRNASVINQLDYLQNINLLSSVNPSSIAALPPWSSTAFTVNERTRAYLDVNCAHCHSRTGVASETGLQLNYQLSLNDTGIKSRKGELLTRMDRGDMPRLGTSLVHTEGLDLIKKFIEGL